MHAAQHHLPRITHAHWTLSWFTHYGHERNYVPHQLLRRVRIDRIERHLDPDRLPLKSMRNHTIAVVRNHPSHREASAAANARLVQRYVQAGLRIAVVVIGDQYLASACGERPCTQSERAAAAGQCRHPLWRCCETRDALSQLYRVAPLVLRNYWSSGCAALPNVIQVPLGVRGSITHSHRDRRRHRRLVWAFASRHRTATRDAMVAALASRPRLAPFYRAYPRGDDENFTRSLCLSSFALCPSGEHVDTWRLMEALDCGAIPVVDDASMAYYRELMPEALTRHLIDFGWRSGRRKLGVTSGGGGGGTEYRPGRPHNASTAEALELMEALVRQPSALEVRRLALVAAFEAWNGRWTRRIGARLDLLSDPEVAHERSRRSKRIETTAALGLYLVSGISILLACATASGMRSAHH